MVRFLPSSRGLSGSKSQPGDAARNLFIHHSTQNLFTPFAVSDASRTLSISHVPLGFGARDR
jgi:hypothetical protein